MCNIIQKKSLRNGYYYSGYVLQNYCVVSSNQPQIIGMWDQNDNCFWFWDYDSNIKSKRKIMFFNDLDKMDEITDGFVPIKEIIPKEENLIE